jgi:hypothetical protein
LGGRGESSELTHAAQSPHCGRAPRIVPPRVGGGRWWQICVVAEHLVLSLCFVIHLALPWGPPCQLCPGSSVLESPPVALHLASLGTFSFCRDLRFELLLSPGVRGLSVTPLSTWSPSPWPLQYLPSESIILERFLCVLSKNKTTHTCFLFLFIFYFYFFFIIHMCIQGLGHFSPLPPPPPLPPTPPPPSTPPNTQQKLFCPYF